MGEHTPNLNLYKPKATQPVEKGWGALVNESIDVIDTELNAAAKSVFLVGDVVNYVSNAVYTGGKWNRRNTGLGATRVAFDPSARTITVYYVNAGANPISWVKVETFSTSGIDMGGKKVANMATPSVASDAATKGYIDGLIAALKLSQIAIDADKNWNRKRITNISSLSSSIYTSTNVKLLPINLGFRPKTIRKTLTGSRSGKGTVDLGTFTIPSEYIEGSIIGVEGWVQVKQQQTYTAVADINVKVNGVTVKTFQAYSSSTTSGATKKVDFEDYIPIKGNDVISVTLVGYPLGSQYDISSCSGNIMFFGEDVLPSVCVHPTW